MSNARGPDAGAPARDSDREPGGPPSREAQARALAKALVLVSAKQPAWTRHDLLKQLALVLPPETRRMSAQAAARSCCSAWPRRPCPAGPEMWCAWRRRSGRRCPPSLRRELDGRSVYTRPGVARYATAAQLSAEERLVAHAQAQGAPRLPGDLAARRLGADAAAAGGAAARPRARTRASTPRRAGCGWIRPRPPGTC